MVSDHRMPHPLTPPLLGGVDEDNKELFPEYDTESLLKFLQKAAQVCEMLYEWMDRWMKDKII